MALQKKTLTFLFISCIAFAFCEEPPSVNSPLGKISGFYMATRDRRKISAFTSVPFAAPPIEDLRFKAPVAIRGWNATLNATSPAPLCVQRNPYIRQAEIVGQEDCLYLNIYTPLQAHDLLKITKKLPVMVFIHGGGWMCGDGGGYGPHYLLDRDIVLVTINYRLGPLGFLSTQDEHCPGNNGLKDQREALRFVQRIIESFGGDKHSVTIFGESAGGASVNFHMLSKTSQGLFHKAISESGTALVPWAEAPPGEALRNGFRLAKLLGCPQAPSVKMLACLRNKNSYEIIDTEFNFYAWDYEPMTPFKAVVEPDLPGAFLTKSARRSFEAVAVPWMTGINSDEGCLKSVWITKYPRRLEQFISGFDAIAPVTFYYDNSPFVNNITKCVKDKYLKVNKSEGIKHIYTDSYFAYPMVEAVEKTMRYSKQLVYLYELVYEANNSFSQIFGDPVGKHGVCHADDLMYLFHIPFLSNKPSAKDLEMSRLLVTLWTNFATTSNPTKPNPVSFEWFPATSRMDFLELSVEPSMKTGLASRSRFWATLPLWHIINKNFWFTDI